MLPHISCSGAGTSLNLQSLVVEKCPSMSVWAFCVHRQINRAGGVTDPNNLVHYSRRFSDAEESAHFSQIEPWPLLFITGLWPTLGPAEQGWWRGVMLLQQTGVVAMTPCISTSNKTACKLFRKSKTSWNLWSNSFSQNWQMLWIKQILI